MIEFTLRQIAEFLHEPYHGKEVKISGVATDSRQVKSGDLFITWKGEAMDGHQFCQEAIDKGAAAFIVNRPTHLKHPELVVSDSILAFGKIASHWRETFNLPVIGVTGTNGKTTVKNILASIFKEASHNHFLAPVKSFNNFVGVPLTLCQLTKEHQFAVIEMGMNHFGELCYLTNIVHPTVAVINNAGPGHLAGVGSLEGVAKAKGEILEGLGFDGIAVLNRDDTFFTYWKEQARPHHLMTFGIEHEADVMAVNIHMKLDGSEFELKTEKESIVINLPLLGRHNVMNALCAATAALAVKVDLDTIKKGLETAQPEAHRLHFKRARHGVGLLDDCYNANPNSVKKAIDVLKYYPGKRILVLGDMRELGEEERAFHEEVGHYAKVAGIDYLFAVGDLMQYCVACFGKGGEYFENKAALLKHLDIYLNPENTILVKGSLSTKMAEVVACLMEENYSEMSQCLT